MLLFGYFAICSHLRSAELGVGASIAEFSVFLRIGRVWLLCFAQEVQLTGYYSVKWLKLVNAPKRALNLAQARHGIDHRTGTVRTIEWAPNSGETGRDAEHPRRLKYATLRKIS